MLKELVARLAYFAWHRAVDLTFLVRRVVLKFAVSLHTFVPVLYTARRVRRREGERFR